MSSFADIRLLQSFSPLYFNPLLIGNECLGDRIRFALGVQHRFYTNGNECTFVPFLPLRTDVPTLTLY
jgi:hypothetical protein